VSTPRPRAAIADLRQYTLEPGRRDELIGLFEEHFVDGQEAAGMHVVGQFRDLDDPDRFVWIRAFDSMPARQAALEAFYYGPVWQAHRAAANDTMIDSDDALLLRPLHLSAGYPTFGTPRPAPVDHSSVVGVTVLYRDRPIDAAYCELVLDAAVPELAAAGGDPLAVFVTEPAANNFPALPLRDENVVAWVARFADDDAYARHRDRLSASRAWRGSVQPQLLATASGPAQELRLRPTRRSHLS
jgi:quinol monooxygenase YgiN